MIKINKGREPLSLTQYRSTPNATYDGMPTDIKDDVKHKLLLEQGFICAYCMSRIRLENTQIEHFIAQNPNSDFHKETDLAYSNMLAVCPGNEGNPKRMQTCDEHRGNTPLTVNPLNEKTLKSIQYLNDGEIISSDESIQYDLNNTLNLNFYLLKGSRMSQLRKLQEQLKKEKDKGDWKSLAIKYRRKLLEANVEKREYIGILIWYLDKKIRQGASK